MASNDLEERLAALEHEQWVQWSRTIAAEGLSPERIDRWKQYWVSYAELTEEVKEFDREWARKALKTLPVQVTTALLRDIVSSKAFSQFSHPLQDRILGVLRAWER